MMPMNQKKEKNIRIANMLPIPVSVADSTEEETWLEAADRVNNLWRKWALRFPDKSSEEVLAMVTLRFAQAFVIHNSAEEETLSALDDFENTVDSLLHGSMGGYFK